MAVVIYNCTWPSLYIVGGAKDLLGLYRALEDMPAEWGGLRLFGEGRDMPLSVCDLQI